MKSLAWLAVLVLAACWVVRPRGMADEPISVTSPLIFTPSSASTRTSAGWPILMLRMSVSSTMTSTSMTDRSATGAGVTTSGMSIRARTGTAARLTAEPSKKPRHAATLACSAITP